MLLLSKVTGKLSRRKAELLIEQHKNARTSLGRCSLATSTRFTASCLSTCSSSRTPFPNASISALQFVSLRPAVISAVFRLTVSASDAATPHMLGLAVLEGLLSCWFFELQSTHPFNTLYAVVQPIELNAPYLALLVLVSCKHSQQVRRHKGT